MLSVMSFFCFFYSVFINHCRFFIFTNFDVCPHVMRLGRKGLINETELSRTVHSRASVERSQTKMMMTGWFFSAGDRATLWWWWWWLCLMAQEMLGQIAPHIKYVVSGKRVGRGALFKKYSCVPCVRPILRRHRATSTDLCSFSLLCLPIFGSTFFGFGGCRRVGCAVFWLKSDYL